MVHGKTVYLAGQVADDTSLDAEGQTRDILRQIDALLAEAGTSKAWLLSVQIFLADMDEAVQKSPRRQHDFWRANFRPALRDHPPHLAIFDQQIFD